MEKPTYKIQRTFIYIGYIVAGVMGFGALLDAISNAITVITPAITYGGTVFIALMWAVGQWYLKNYGVWWKTSPTDSLKIKSVGISITLFLTGIVILLWLPFLFSTAPAPLSDTPPLTYLTPPMKTKL